MKNVIEIILQARSSKHTLCLMSYILKYILYQYISQERIDSEN